MVGGPLFSPLGGLEPLHRHQEEASRQHLLTPATTWQQQARLTWDLVAALWGRLDSQVRMMGRGLSPAFKKNFLFDKALIRVQICARIRKCLLKRSPGINSLESIPVILKS